MPKCKSEQPVPKVGNSRSLVANLLVTAGQAVSSMRVKACCMYQTDNRDREIISHNLNKQKHVKWNS